MFCSSWMGADGMMAANLKIEPRVEIRNLRRL